MLHFPRNHHCQSTALWVLTVWNLAVIKPSSFATLKAEAGKTQFSRKRIGFSSFFQLLLLSTQPTKVCPPGNQRAKTKITQTPKERTQPLKTTCKVKHFLTKFFILLYPKSGPWVKLSINNKRFTICQFCVENTWHTSGRQGKHISVESMTALYLFICTALWLTTCRGC